MSFWLDAVLLAAGLGGMLVGLFDRQHGRRFAAVAAVITVLAAARLFPAAAAFRTGAWIVAGVLMIYVFATTPKAVYRRLKRELALAAAAVAIIGSLELFPDLPTPVVMTLLAALVLVVAAFAVLAVARVARSASQPK